MIKEVFKALIGVGKLPDKPFELTLGRILLFSFMLIGSFLGTVLLLLYLTSIILRNI
jgi:hypothetical protein